MLANLCQTCSEHTVDRQDGLIPRPNMHTDRFQTKLGIAKAITKIIVTCKRCNRTKQ